MGKVVVVPSRTTRANRAKRVGGLVLKEVLAVKTVLVQGVMLMSVMKILAK